MTLRERLGMADEPLDPEVERELATIDAVLAAGGSPGPSEESPDSPRLAQLARELRAERSAPDPDFAARLDRWAAEGFPRRGELRPARRNVVDDGPAWVSALHSRLAATPPRRIVAPAGAALTFAVVVAVGVGALSGRDEPTGVAVAPAPQASDQAPSPATAEPPEADVAGGAAEVPDLDIGGRGGAYSQRLGDQGLAPRRENRRVERDVQLQLSTTPDEVPDVADGAIGIARTHGGIVVSSRVDSGDRQPGASLELAIPTARLDAAIDNLTELAHVAALSEGSVDITRPFVSARNRFRDGRAELLSLREQLAAETDPERVAVLKQRIDVAEAELARHRAAFDRISKRARVATVFVTIDGRGSSEDEGEGEGAWGIGDALDDAARVLVVIAGVLVVTAAVVVPIALIVLLAWLAARFAAQRRREAALD